MVRAWRTNDFRTIFHLACQTGATPEAIADNTSLSLELVLNVMKGNTTLTRDSGVAESFAVKFNMPDDLRTAVGLTPRAEQSAAPVPLKREIKDRRPTPQLPAGVKLRGVVGDRIAELRHERGLTQEQLAERAGISRVTVDKLEQCARAPSLAMLDSVANALDVPAGELIDPPPPKARPGRRRSPLPDCLPVDILNRPDFIAACGNRDLGAIFKISMEADFTYSHLARRCGMTITQVTDYIKRGREAQSVDIFDRVSDGLHIPGDMLGIGVRSWESGDSPEVGSEPTPSGNIEEFSDEATSWRLSGIPGAAVSGVFTPDDEDRIIHVARRSSGTDASVVDPLARMLAAQREAEDSVGSIPFIQPVVAQLATIENLVIDARGVGRPAIVDVAAQWAEFAGWLHTSAGYSLEARKWFDRAGEWAVEAGNRTLAATSLSFKGHVAFLLGEIGPMLGLTQAAQRDSSIWIGQLAFDAQQEALAWAVMGDSDAAMRKADEGASLALLVDGRSDERPAYSYYYTMSLYAAEHALVYRFLGRDNATHNDRAIAELRSALHDMGEARSSEWAGEYIYHLAVAYIQAGAQDKACESAFEILEIVRSLGSSRLMKRLQGIYKRLADQWSNDPRVAELADALHTLP